MFLFNNFSKNKVLIGLLSLGLIFSASDTLAKTSNKTAKIKIRCHVELVGGKDIIHFGIIKNERKTNYAQWLEGKKIATGFSKQKQQVYKVIECVTSKNKFINLVSANLDENTVR